MTNNNNLEEKLKQLFEYLQKEYTAKKEQTMESSGFLACSYLEKLDCIDSIVYMINKVYNTNKNLEETMKSLFEYLQEDYRDTEEYAMESGFLASSYLEKLNCINNTVDIINKLYNTNYNLKSIWKETNNNNLEETLTPLFEHLQTEYTATEEDFMLSGMFSGGAREETLVILEGIVNKINKLYNTNYVLKKEGK